MISAGYNHMMAEELFVVNLFGTDREIDLLDRLIGHDAGSSHLDEINKLIQAVRKRVVDQRSTLKQAA